MLTWLSVTGLIGAAGVASGAGSRTNSVPVAARIRLAGSSEWPAALTRSRFVPFHDRSLRDGSQSPKLTRSGWPLRSAARYCRRTTGQRQLEIKARDDWSNSARLQRGLQCAAYNSLMSHKRYQFKLVEAADAPDLETRLREAGSQQWSAVGYGVLPDGRRSVLMQRKVKSHTRHRDDGRRESAVLNDE